MDEKAVIKEPETLYPGKSIKRLPADAPKEIVCEFDPATAGHPDWSLAVAIIDRSVPHYHEKTTEIYHIIRGTLTLHVDGQDFVMYEGQQFTVQPGRIHWAEGNETWVEVYCNPGYSSDDHFLAE